MQLICITLIGLVQGFYVSSKEQEVKKEEVKKEEVKKETDLNEGYKMVLY